MFPKPYLLFLYRLDFPLSLLTQPCIQEYLTDYSHPSVSHLPAFTFSGQPIKKRFAYDGRRLPDVIKLHLKGRFSEQNFWHKIPLYPTFRYGKRGPLSYRICSTTRSIIFVLSWYSHKTLFLCIWALYLHLKQMCTVVSIFRCMFPIHIICF